jgi:hypothetical protein
MRSAEALPDDNAPCDQLFSSGTASADPSAALQSAYANNHIRLVPFGQNIPSGVGAETAGTGANGLILIALNRFFVTGVLANGIPVTQASSPNFQGLSLSQIDAVIIIHEFLHLTGAVGDDNAGQSITLANGVTVVESAGLTNEVIKDCIHQ